MPDDRMAIARRWRGGMAAGLLQWTVDSVKSASGKHRAVAGELNEGPFAGMGVTLDGRWMPWPIDAGDEALRLASCERSASIMVGSEGPVAVPHRCKSRVCPVCQRRKAALECSRFIDALEELQRSGMHLRQWTLTQVTREEGPAPLVLPREMASGWDGATLPESRELGDNQYLPTVRGQSLLGSYTRLRESMRALRKSSVASLVRREWGGYLFGVEWTGHGKGQRVPRWHAHVHILTASEVANPADTARIIEKWTEVAPGALAQAQDVRDVAPGRIREVIKYPMKPVQLTSAQRLEALCCLKGLKPHQAAGALHGSDRRSTEEVWDRARQLIRPLRSDGGYGRLYFRASREHAWALFHSGVPGALRKGGAVVEFAVERGPRMIPLEGAANLGRFRAQLMELLP